MKTRYLTIAIVLVTFTAALAAMPALADTLKCKDGSKIDGTVNKIDSGKVYVEVGSELKIVNLSDIENIDFTKPAETRDIVTNLQQLDEAEAKIRVMLSQIASYWSAKQPIDAKDEIAWEAARQEFEKPLIAYQEILNDLYFHVLGRVDDYNKLMKQADVIYVGVKGIRFGSPLLTDMRELPLRRYVPALWYETIYDAGYNTGFSEAAARTIKPYN